VKINYKFRKEIMKSNYFESAIGFIILIISAFFLFKYISVNFDRSEYENYELSANFLKVGGIQVGNDVKLRGVKVGTVSSVTLNDEYFAEVKFFVYSNILIPKDSQVSVASEGILGNKYLSIIPGDKSSGFLQKNELIEKVNDYESIEDQVSKIIFLATQ
tara:strand:- start:27733 stop:28212 length:480 start_codon:yes stop_codon:yes gene_type:complete